MSEHTDENGAPEDDGLPCLATGETDVDGAVLPVACDLWLGHDRSHYDQTMIVFWGREHGGREYAIPPGSPAPSPTQGAGAEEAEGRG